MTDCIFCKIVAKEIPADVVFESDTVLAFKDLQPVAPMHILIIPKQHIRDSSALTRETAPVMADMFLAAGRVAGELGIDDNGYRLVMNKGRDGGQSVFHVHMHMLGGRHLTWPPG